jgi:hypothetical protein
LHRIRASVRWFGSLRFFKLISFPQRKTQNANCQRVSTDVQWMYIL